MNYRIWHFLPFLIFFRLSEEYLRFVGHEPLERSEKDTVKKAIFIPNPNERFRFGRKQKMAIIGWNVYIHRPNQKIHLQVWRYAGEVRGSGARLKYKLVGQTILICQSVGPYSFQLLPRDRILIERNDVLGVYFPSHNPIPWEDFGSCDDKKKHLFQYYPMGVTVGQNSTFSKAADSWRPCRRYSFNASLAFRWDLPKIKVNQSVLNLYKEGGEWIYMKHDKSYEPPSNYGPTSFPSSQLFLTIMLNMRLNLW